MDVRVAFYLKKSETNADGCCPVMARLTVGNHSEAAFSAKMSVPVSSWESGRATGKSAATREINRKLSFLVPEGAAQAAEEEDLREEPEKEAPTTAKTPTEPPRAHCPSCGTWYQEALGKCPVCGRAHEKDES